MTEAEIRDTAGRLERALDESDGRFTPATMAALEACLISLETALGYGEEEDDADGFGEDDDE